VAQKGQEIAADKKRFGRRKLVAALGIGAGAALVPKAWIKPVADVVVVPLNAQASPPPPPPPPPS
jgi:hypothetical protein